MNVPHSPTSQHGSVLTLEYLVLMISGGISTLGVTVLLAGHFPEITIAWFGTLIDTAEAAFEDYNDNWCTQAAIPTGTGATNLLAALACDTGGGGGAAWTSITGP